MLKPTAIKSKYPVIPTEENVWPLGYGKCGVVHFGSMHQRLARHAISACAEPLASLHQPKSCLLYFHLSRSDNLQKLQVNGPHDARLPSARRRHAQTAAVRTRPPAVADYYRTRLYRRFAVEKFLLSPEFGTKFQRGVPLFLEILNFPKTQRGIGRISQRKHASVCKKSARSVQFVSIQCRRVTDTDTETRQLISAPA